MFNLFHYTLKNNFHEESFKAISWVHATRIDDLISPRMCTWVILRDRQECSPLPKSFHDNKCQTCLPTYTYTYMSEHIFPPAYSDKHCISSAKCYLPIPPQLSLSLVLYMHFCHPPLPPSHPRSWNIPWKISEAHIFCELWLLALWLSETTDSTVQYR